jgi:hypothetical protein
MRQLINYLRANGFRVFVSTAGSVDVARVLSEQLYGIPPDDVIGSSVVTTLRDEDGQLIARRVGTMHSLNRGITRPLLVDMQLGQAPILAVGNARSGGETDLLRFSQRPGRLSLQILVKHDDVAREYGYDEPDQKSATLANELGWLQVSMRYDWLRIFASP